jgi:hypothetical protein
MFLAGGLGVQSQSEVVKMVTSSMWSRVNRKVEIARIKAEGGMLSYQLNRTVDVHCPRLAYHPIG